MIFENFLFLNDTYQEGQALELINILKLLTELIYISVQDLI